MIRIFFISCLVTYCLSATAQTKRFSFTQPKMGSPFNLVFYTTDSANAALLAKQAFQLVDSLNVIFSDYLPTSELNRLSATAGKDSFVKVSPLLFQIISESKDAWRKSYGTYDITIGPLSWLWRKARKEKRFPTATEIKEAKAKTGFEKVIIDTITKRIKLLQPYMQLDLGGIAKGFSAQQVINFLQLKGVQVALADAGGDIVCSNPPPNTNGWRIGVNIPEQETELLDKRIRLANKAVATSGDVYQYTVHNGKKYSHIIDPRTGYGVTFQRNVTIIANDGGLADWLATACSILPIKKAKRLVSSFGAELLITQLKKQKIKIYTSKEFNKYWNKS